MKKIMLLMLAFLMVGCGEKETKKETEDKVYTLKIGTSQGDRHPIYKGILEMKKNVEERTGGKVIIEGYPSGQLGGDEDVIEQAKLGANVALVVDGGKLSEYTRELGVLSIAYAADSYEEMRDMANTKAFQGWLKKLEDSGLSALSYNWFQGTRNFYSNKKIEKPEDLDGMLVRTPGAPAWSKSIEALGATPVGLPWNEVYPAMQQKVIDAFEAQTSSVEASSLQETVKYMTRTGHFQLMTGLVTGKKWMDSLPEEYRKIVLEESLKAGNFASELDLKGAKVFEDRMENEFGIEINNIDISSFKLRGQKVFKELGYENEYNLIKEELKK